MKRTFKYLILTSSALILMVAALSSCNGTKGTKDTANLLSVKTVRSEMSRCPDGSYLDGMNGTLKWNYTTGLELLSFLDVYRTYGGDDILRYVDGWYDRMIDEKGTIYKYKVSNYSTDHICPGRTLFDLYDITGKEKYRCAMDTLWKQIQGQPRTPEGGFWHKQVYENQMWLDGLYMAQPFYAIYVSRYIPEKDRLPYYNDIISHFRIVADHTFDPSTGLYRHAWDSSHKMFWADPVTGQSLHAWGRALGWYSMALVDVLEVIPQDVEARKELLDILGQIFIVALPKVADAATGLWYQVLDRPGGEGNYLEATCCAMFSYSLLKAVRLGYLPSDMKDYALRTYDAFQKEFVAEDENGEIELRRCCEVAGLGGKDNRSGDYAYYIGEKVRSNDPKGIGPLIWAALEKERQEK